MKKRKTELKWALIFIIMTLLWMVLEKISGLHGKYIDYQMYLTNLYAIPAVWIYVLALKEKKKKDFGGWITYGEGVVSGLVMTLIIAVFSPAMQWIISYVITPEYFPNVIKRSVELGYFKTSEEAAATFNFRNYAIQSTIFALIMGMVTTLIVMLFIRSKKSKLPQYDNFENNH